MNEIQQRLMDLAKVHDIRCMRRVDLKELVGCEYPSQITHHLNQLLKRGDLVSKEGRYVPSLRTKAGFYTVPVMGEADCGEATKFADGRVVDNIIVSPSIVKNKDISKVYALIARGDSMNKADIDGSTIENGDFVLVEKTESYEPKPNEIIVSIIGGLANIKRFQRESDRIVLKPDSMRDDYFPIFIDASDDFAVEGRVVGVIKKPL